MRRCHAASIAFLAVLFLAASAVAQSDGDGDLQAAAQNPVADLISLPFQNNTYFGIGPNDETVNVLNIQPVVPFKLSDDWNLVTRTIVPLIYVPGTVEGLDVLPSGGGNDTRFGLGDINMTAFFVPAKPSKLIWGIGPTLTAPTASDDVLGSEKWSAGVSGVLLAQPAPWTVGVLARQIWSFAGDDNRADVRQFLVQPFVNYNLADGWYLTTSPVVTANWEAPSRNRWTVPVGGGVGRLMRIGQRPVNISAQSYYNVEHPDFGPDWSLRLQIQLLFPK